MGHDVLSHGCRCKMHFKNVKKFQTKISGVHMKNVYLYKKVSHRKDILCDRYKKENKMLRAEIFLNAEDLSSLHRPHKMFFHPIFCTNINVHMYIQNFCLKFFDILKFIVWVVSVDAHMSRSGFPI